MKSISNRRPFPPAAGYFALSMEHKACSMIRADQKPHQLLENVRPQSVFMRYTSKTGKWLVLARECGDQMDTCMRSNDASIWRVPSIRLVRRNEPMPDEIYKCEAPPEKSSINPLPISVPLKKYIPTAVAKCFNIRLKYVYKSSPK